MQEFFFIQNQFQYGAIAKPQIKYVFAHSSQHLTTRKKYIVSGIHPAKVSHNDKTERMRHLLSV